MRLDELSKTRYVVPSAQAYVQLGLGNNDLALDLLEQACGERDVEMAFLRVDPVLAPLRNEPRFQALLERVGFE